MNPHSPVAPYDSVHENHKQNWWKGVTLVESTMNVFDFVLKIWSQLSLWLYKAGWAQAKAPYTHCYPHRIPKRVKKLVQSSAETTESELLLLYPRFNNWPEPSFLGRHPSLPIPRYSSQPPCNIEEACQPRQPNNIRSLQYLRRLSSTPGAMLLGRILTTSMT